MDARTELPIWDHSGLRGYSFQTMTAMTGRTIVTNKCTEEAKGNRIRAPAFLSFLVPLTSSLLPPSLSSSFVSPFPDYQRHHPYMTQCELVAARESQNSHRIIGPAFCIQAAKQSEAKRQWLFDCQCIATGIGKANTKAKSLCWINGETHGSAHSLANMYSSLVLCQSIGVIFNSYLLDTGAAVLTSPRKVRPRRSCDNADWFRSIDVHNKVLSQIVVTLDFLILSLDST
jgi:hypothetical protein